MKGQLYSSPVCVLYSTLYITPFRGIHIYIQLNVFPKFFCLEVSFIYLHHNCTLPELGDYYFQLLCDFILKVCPIDIAGPVSTIFCTVAFFRFVVLHLSLEFIGTQDILATITSYVTVNCDSKPATDVMTWAVYSDDTTVCSPTNQYKSIEQCPNINSGYKTSPKFHVVSIHV